MKWFRTSHIVGLIIGVIIAEAYRKQQGKS